MNMRGLREVPVDDRRSEWTSAEWTSLARLQGTRPHLLEAVRGCTLFQWSAVLPYFGAAPCKGIACRRAGLRGSSKPKESCVVSATRTRARNMC